MRLYGIKFCSVMSKYFMSKISNILMLPNFSYTDKTL